MELTTDERRLLQNLAEHPNRYSQYAEYYRAVLDSLVAKGLVEIVDDEEAAPYIARDLPQLMLRLYRVTDAGRKEALTA